ncbi:hypothetical protein C8E05_4236 [Rhodococcus wratislaviensis]|uniref:Uncharacterized protein n=3 Tax=Rhodococcus TaxID=1827 RepID=A0AB38FIX0_RHOWR|nr:hypothetical protein C8E05_4236 [Rhodococcus wratislaviensis]SPZ41668.1 Uncharacterised protein [Rhodococcus wratislaviensis]
MTLVTQWEDDGVMIGDDELLQIEQVIERLTTRYPTVSPVDIEHIVRTVHKRLAKGRIRDFVPLLVEKAARRELSDRAATEAVS